MGTGPHSQVGALTEASPYKGGRTNKSPHMQAYALTHSDTTRSLYFIVILLQCRLLLFCSEYFCILLNVF